VGFDVDEAVLAFVAAELEDTGMEEFAGGGFRERHCGGFPVACMAGFGGVALCRAAGDGETNSMRYVL
jgi:hypothetical protein